MGRLYTIVDGLSPEGRRALATGAKEKWTAERTAQAIQDATGEAVAERTVARHLANLRSEDARRQAARQQMQDLVDALKAGNGSAADMIQALAMETLVADPDALANADPIAMQRAGLAAEELRLKRDALAVKARAVAVQEARLDLLERKERRLVEALDPAKTEMTPEERLARVNEILGITGASSAAR